MPLVATGPEPIVTPLMVNWTLPLTAAPAVRVMVSTDDVIAVAVAAIPVTLLAPPMSALM
jgi:hypothetical protein